MSVLAKTLGFCLALTLVFTGVSNLLPQVEGEAPVEVEINLSELTMEDFVAMGEDLFNNKGTCTLCHKPAPLGRAPDIQGMDMVATANERLADDRYAGKATNAAAYILESLIEPSEYVVSGWGKKGSDDKESPMPAIDKPPIQLSQVEIDAVIAYLQAKDGNEVTVALPSADAAAAVAKKDTTQGGSKAAPAPATTGDEALVKYACSACHALDSADALVGPGLLNVGSRLTPAQIRESIVNPNAVITEGFPAAMPADFAEKMTVKELEMIVALLAEKKE
jgi:mono/diheme cytochrome c family protein